jgi:hypothetical protein
MLTVVPVVVPRATGYLDIWQSVSSFIHDSACRGAIRGIAGGISCDCLTAALLDL